MPTCHHAAIYHRGLLNGVALSNAHMPSCSHIPPGPSERRCSVQCPQAIMQPYTPGAFRKALLCPMPTCHHAPIRHWGLLDGVALSNAHMSNCSHIPPGPSEWRCSVQCPHVIMHPYAAGAFWMALSCPMPAFPHAAVYHRGLLKGVALSNALMSSCSHIPPGPSERRCPV